MAIGDKLKFLSDVHVPSIPLHFAVGPLYEVSTDQVLSASWLRHKFPPLKLSENAPSPRFQNNSLQEQLRKQSDRGLLLGVETRCAQSIVTEVLLYAARCKRDGILTGGGNASTDRTVEDGKVHEHLDVNEWKLYALPLCSNILDQLKVNLDNYVSGLPTRHIDFATSALENRAQNGKRPKISELLGDASFARRKLKGRGGERVSRAMASSMSLGDQNLASRVAEEHAAPAPAEATSSFQPVQGQKSRAPSRSGTSIGNGNGDMLPASEKMLAQNHESGFERVYQMSTDSESHMMRQETAQNTSQQNRTALTKIVLAGMRLYGLQSKKRDPPENGKCLDLYDSVTAPQVETDEYKTVYHQTFKASIFVFRNHLDHVLIAQDAMRDIVDKLLMLFCSNPLANGAVDETSFDPPSLQRRPGSRPCDSDKLEITEQDPTLPHNSIMWATPTKKKGH